jgi:hypothetical protein
LSKSCQKVVKKLVNYIFAKVRTKSQRLKILNRSEEEEEEEEEEEGDL